MAVELCKVSLWLESNNPGWPLSFLDHRIVCGNSLLGTTPKLLADGIPDAAFKPLTGDKKEHSRSLRKRNKDELKHPHQGVLSTWSPASDAAYLTEALSLIDAAPADTASQVAAKQAAHDRLQNDAQAVKANLIADAWCAAFVSLKTPDILGITDRTLRRLQQMPPEQVSRLVKAARDPQASLGDALSLHRLVRVVVGLADEYQFTHLHLAFPEIFHVPENLNDATNERTGWSSGFDAVIGNPPWDQIQYDPRETFAATHPDIAEAPTMAKRNALLCALAVDEPDTYERYQRGVRHLEGVKHLVHASGRYPLGSVGRLNTAPLFLEMMWHSISPQGRTGAVVPTGIATDSFTQKFFQELVDSEALASLYDFENSGPTFPAVHRSFKFCLLTLSGSARPVSRANFAFFLFNPSELDDSDRFFHLTPEDFGLLNPNTRTCPIFRSRRDARITLSIYQRVPIFINKNDPEGNPWDASFQLMFMMKHRLTSIPDQRRT